MLLHLLEALKLSSWMNPPQEWTHTPEEAHGTCSWSTKQEELLFWPHISCKHYFNHHFDQGKPHLRSTDEVPDETSLISKSHNYPNCCVESKCQWGFSWSKWCLVVLSWFDKQKCVEIILIIKWFLGRKLRVYVQQNWMNLSWLLLS